MDGFNEFLAWCVAMYEYEGSIQGKLTLANWHFDVSRGYISESIAQKFASKVAEAWKNALFKDRSKPIKLYEIAVGDYYHEDNTLFCSGIRLKEKITPHPPRCSRVMNFKTFIQFCTDERQREKDFPDLPNSMDDDYARNAIEKFQDKKNLSLLFTKKSLKNVYGFAWVTLTEELDKIEASTQPEHLATQVALKIGLMYEKKIPLVRIDYPSDVLETVKFAPPTALEGAPSNIYRSCTRGDGYGRTVHKKTYEDGVSELVHNSLDLSDLFTIKYLGIADETDFDEYMFYDKHRNDHRDVCNDELPTKLAELIYR